MQLRITKTRESH